MGKKLDEEIFTPKESPSLEEVLNSEQETIENEGINNEIKDVIHTFVKTSNIEVPQGNEVESGAPLTVTIDDQIITPKKNRIDFQGYELDNVSQADTDYDVPNIKQVRDIVEEVESEKQDKLTAGENITISSSNVISATDTTYTAGSGITLTDTEFSIGSKAIETGMLADASVTNDKLAENAVTTDEIADDSITTAKLGDYAVTDEQLASNSVTGDKIPTTVLDSGTITLTAKTGFTISSQDCGYVKIKGKTCVIINASIKGALSAMGATEVCTIADLPTISGSASPQLSGELSLGWTDPGNYPVGCWIRESSLAIAVENNRSVASASTGTIRINGCYIF